MNGSPNLRYSDISRLWTPLALTWLMTSPGMPVLYYGTEIGMPEAPVHDPKTGRPQDFLNRMPYPDQLNIRESAHRLHSTVLMKLRQTRDALRVNEFLPALNIGRC